MRRPARVALTSISRVEQDTHQAQDQSVAEPGVEWQGVGKAAQVTAAEDQVGASIFSERREDSGEIGGRIGVVAIQEGNNLGAVGEGDFGACPARGAVPCGALDEDARTVRLG